LKTATATLTAAFNAKSWKPQFQVIIDDRSTGVPRPRWTNWYTGTEANTGHSAACGLDYDGWVIHQLYVDRTANKLYYRKTAITGTPAASWTELAATVRDAQCGIAADNAGKLWAVWVDTDNKTIKYRTSTDRGANWAAAATVVAVAAGHKVSSLAITCPTVTSGSPLQEAIVIYVDSASETEGTADRDIRVIRYASAAWGADASWGRAAGKSCRGIAAIQHDCTSTQTYVYFTLCGKFEVTSKGYNVNVYLLGINAAATRTYTLLGTPLQSQSSSFAWSWPSMVPEVTDDRTRIFMAKYDPALPTAKRWAQGSIYIQDLLTTTAQTFGQWLPFRTISQYTIGAARSSTSLVAGSATDLWKAPMYDQSTTYRVDVSADVIAFEHRVFDNSLFESALIQPGYGYLFLDNHDGRYDNLGVSGTYQAIKRGSQVLLYCGYRTTAGVEMELLPPMWVNKIIEVCNPRGSVNQSIPHLGIPGGPAMGGSYIVLSLYDAWSIVINRSPTSLFQKTAAPRDVLKEAFGQMGFLYSDSGTSRLASGGSNTAKWSTLPGQSWLKMIRDILKYTHCRMKFYTEADEEATYPTARVYVMAETDCTPADVSYGAATEALLYAGLYIEQDRFAGYRWDWHNPPTMLDANGKITPTGLALTGAVVEGKGVSTEVVNWTQLERLGYWQPLVVRDYHVTDAENITLADRGTSAASDAVQALFGGQIMAPAHPCLEIWDRVFIHDPRASITEIRRFVLGIETFFDTRGPRARFEQVVHLVRHVLTE